jgi:hypothetical protein
MATKKTGSVNSRLAEVLVKLQDRLGRVALEAAEVADVLEERIDALWDVAAEQDERLSELEKSRVAPAHTPRSKKGRALV